MSGLSVKTRIYLIAVIIVGILMLAINLQAFARTSSVWLMTALLSILASFTLILKVEGATNRTHYNLSWLIYGFSLILLGAPSTVMVILISHIVEWIWRKYPWYIQAFNLTSYVIVATVAGLPSRLIEPTKQFNSWQSILGGIAALVIFTLLNHVLVGMIVWLARGENFTQSGVFKIASLMIDLSLLLMGAGAAVMWVVNPLALVFAIVPLYLLYTTLRVPSLERQTETDPKTGLYNAKYLADAVETELKRAHRFDRPLTLVMMDLDLLRNINNTYGHLAGDEVLLGIARILKEMKREYDTVARFGGEEFTLLMPETSAQDAFMLVEAIRKRIEAEPFSVPASDTTINATMSFGIAERVPGICEKDLVHNADLALYHSKLKGRNRTYIYSRVGIEDRFTRMETRATDRVAL